MFQDLISEVKHSSVNAVGNFQVVALYAFDPGAGLLFSVWRPRGRLNRSPEEVKARKVDLFYSYNDDSSNFEQSPSRDPALADGFTVKKSKFSRMLSPLRRKSPTQRC